MKQVASLFPNIEKPSVVPSRARTAKEDLIEQIVARTTVTDKRALARQIAIAANTNGWTTAELHALLKKADDPSILRYTGFVKWSCAVRKRA